MTDYERNSFGPITKRETIVRAHSPHSEAAGPIIREGTVAARIRAFHSAPEVNSYTAPNTGILSRVRLRPKKATSPTSSPSTQGGDNRSGYGRRKSPSFAPPASRNATIAGQHHVSLTQYRPPSSVLPGSGAGTRLPEVGNRFVVVGLDKLSQHVVFSSQAILSPKHADPEEGVGLSHSTKPVWECGLAERDSVNNEEVSAEQKEVLKKRNIAEELSVLFDKAVDDNNSSQTKWSSDSPNPDTLDHHGQALGELNPFPPPSAPLVPVLPRQSSPDYHPIAATKYSSTSSGSDHSNRHSHHRKSKRHRKCSTAEETILPRSSSDSEEDAPSLDDNAESDTTVQRHFPHIEATPASLPATISSCSPRTHAHYHGCQHQHQLPRWGTTPPRTAIGHKNNQLQEISPPRLIRKYEISSLLQEHKHSHDHSQSSIPRNHLTPDPHTYHHPPSPHHHPHHHLQPRIQPPIQHPNSDPPPKVPPQQTATPTPPSPPPSSPPPPIPPPPPPPPPSTPLTRLRPPLRQHSLPTLAPPLLSPPTATASLLQSRHLSASSPPTPTTPPPPLSRWWQFLRADNPTQVPEAANPNLRRGMMPPARATPSTQADHFPRRCTHRAEARHTREEIASVHPVGHGQRAGPAAAAAAADETIALATLLLPATDARVSDAKPNAEASSDVHSAIGCSGEGEAGWEEERGDGRGEGGGEKGGGWGIRGVRVVVWLDGDGDVVVEARRGRGGGGGGVEICGCGDGRVGG